MKRIAVLVTCHNRKDKTTSCLKALYACILPNSISFDVFLVDDGSTDGTRKIIEDQFPQVIIIQGDGHLYWNRGMYTAWRTAAEIDYDYYLWLNDDTLLFDDALKTLIETSEHFKNQSIVVGTTRSAIHPLRITYGGRDKYGQLLDPTAAPHQCHYFNGNIVLIPRYVYLKLGTNDFIFRHALGDFDYGLRAAKMNIISYVSSGISGVCEEHEHLAVWCNPSVSFRKRWKAFRTPLGQNPEEFFIYENRHNGIIMAIFHYITNHLRVFFPALWNKKVNSTN